METENELRALPPRTKFLTEYHGIVTVRTIIDKSNGWKGCHDNDFDKSLEYNFGEIKEIKKIIIKRENQIHHFDCEFATGRHCDCWCGEKYHGMQGVGAEIIEVKQI